MQTQKTMAGEGPTYAHEHDWQEEQGTHQLHRPWACWDCLVGQPLSRWAAEASERTSRYGQSIGPGQRAPVTAIVQLRAGAPGRGR